MSERTRAFLERWQTSTNARFASPHESGSAGSLATSTENDLEKPSWSASSHASIWRTAILSSANSDGCGSNDSTSAAAHGASPSRSRRMSQGPNCVADRRIPPMLRSRRLLTRATKRCWGIAPHTSMMRSATGASVAPSTAYPTVVTGQPRKLSWRARPGLVSGSSASSKLIPMPTDSRTSSISSAIAATVPSGVGDKTSTSSSPTPSSANIE